MRTKSSERTRKLVLGGLLTALVIVLQLLGSFTAFFGPFSTAVALIPIVIGAALCGVGIGTWLGIVFALTVLFSGGAALFFAFDIPGTLITVLVKGAACGFAAGFVYRLLKRFNRYLAAVAAAVIAPIVNTGVFLLGCLCFFMDDAAAIGEVLGSTNAGFGLFVGMAFANFLFELGMSVVLAPVIVRLLDIQKKIA